MLNIEGAGVGCWVVVEVGGWCEGQVWVERLKE